MGLHVEQSALNMAVSSLGVLAYCSYYLSQLLVQPLSSAWLLLNFRLEGFLWTHWLLLAGCKCYRQLDFSSSTIAVWLPSPPKFLGNFQWHTRTHSVPNQFSSSTKDQSKVSQNLSLFESLFLMIFFPFTYHQALKCVLLNSFSFIKNRQQQQNPHESNTQIHNVMFLSYPVISKEQQSIWQRPWCKQLPSRKNDWF